LMQIGRSSQSCVGISLRAYWDLRVMPAVFERVLGRRVYVARGASSICYLLLAKKSLVLLLSLDECLLEAVRVCTLSVLNPSSYMMCKLTVAVGKTDSKCLSLRLTLADICGSVPHPAAVASDIW